MSRILIAVPLGIILFGVFLFSGRPADGGCHGGCLTRLGAVQASPSAVGVAPRGEATTGGDPATVLEFYTLTLEPLEDTFSKIYTGEATTFYAASGTITFVVGQSAAPGTVRAVGETATTQGDEGMEYVIEAGGALFVDAQVQELRVKYRNDESTDAVLVIASAVPL